MKPVRKAVLPVAGFGTRVLPATKAVPKEMLTVFDRPAIQYVVDEARAAGIEHFVFVTGRNKSAIEDYFDRAFELEATLAAKKKTAILEEVASSTLPPGSSSFTRQQAPLGLGHAVLCARDIIGDEPFAVLLPDVMVRASPSCLAQMVAAYNEVGGNIVAVDEVPAARVSTYGVIDPAEAGASRPAGEDEGHGREAASRNRRPRASRSPAATSCSPKCSTCWRRRRPAPAARSSSPTRCSA